ncbi:phosphotransferase family protein [Sphingopyxis sp. BSNA05]|uniref:phosphotransferase family protein n=1 Tax=Sphingopyxis sp. BSNA05 TaxID=1236614 RepID=UPI00156372B1|nr:phosphotransferase family protein [Sphingopyxis sp. BSNA05]
MTDEAFQAKLANYCTKTFGADGKLEHLRRLSGGASMESWAFSYGGEDFVLRRLPAGLSADDDGLRGVPLATQADIIELARTTGVTAPEVRGRLAPEDDIGEGFIMAKAEGETLPHKILGNPDFAEAERKLTRQCAGELAAIHQIPVQSLAASLEYFSPAELIRIQKDKYDEIGSQIPIYEYAFHWLNENAPDATDKYLVHGDFRMGNLMIDHDGLSAVLDWELVRLGDPVQDLAYLCTPSWRFGHYEKVAGGFDSAEALLQAYAEASGREVDPDRFRFWLVYSTLWWGVACMVMGQIWRSHGDRSLERTVIGRRVSEVEIDLALLFEEILPAEICTPFDWAVPEDQTVTGETGYGELLTALGEWNAKHVQPGLQGHDKFQSRVAGNALGIARRQAEWGPDFRDAAKARLTAIGYDHGQLCSGLSNGEIAITQSAVWDHLRLSALERLSIDQPKYAGLKVALKNGDQHDRFRNPAGN